MTINFYILYAEKIILYDSLQKDSIVTLYGILDIPNIFFKYCLIAYGDEINIVFIGLLFAYVLGH